MTPQEMEVLSHKLADQTTKAQHIAEQAEKELRSLADDMKASALAWERFSAYLETIRSKPIEDGIDKEIHGKECGCI
jgi:hypothetical protein